MLSGSFLSGCTARDWAAILRENRGRVHLPFFPRAAAISLETVATSLLASVEPNPQLTAPQQALWDQTIFVLGLPRSGTTLLERVAHDNSHREYQKNQHQELTPDERERALKLSQPLLKAGFYPEFLADNL